MNVIQGVKSVFGFGQKTAPAAPPVVRGAGTNAIKKMTTQVVGQLPLSLQLQRIGGNLTPVQVSEIIRQADNGYMYRLVDLANEARQKDCHLQGILGTREMSLAGLDFQVTPYIAPGKKKPKKRDLLIATMVDTWLRCIDGDVGDAAIPLQDFRGLIAHLNGAPYYGYAVSETMFAKRDGYVVPIGFNNISPRRFIFSQPTGALQWCDITAGMAQSSAVDLMVDIPGKFIQYQPRVNGDIACREGLVRPLMWAALFRNWDIRDWLALAELAWKPWRTGQYDKNASDEDIENLIAVLENMTAAGIAVYPETAKIVIEWAKNAVSSGGNSTHAELASFLASEMSKAVLGQTLTTEAGNKGARSLGEVHDKVRGDIKEFDARGVSSVLRRHLIAPLVRMNFGANEKTPGFGLITEEAADLQSFSLGIVNLRKAQLKIPSKWVYDRTGIPVPEASDEILGEGEGEDVPIDPATGMPKDPVTGEDQQNQNDNAAGDKPAADGGDGAANDQQSKD